MNSGKTQLDSSTDLILIGIKAACSDLSKANPWVNYKHFSQFYDLNLKWINCFNTYQHKDMLAKLSLSRSLFYTDWYNALDELKKSGF